MSALLGVVLGVLLICGTVPVYAKLFDKACNPGEPFTTLLVAFVVLMGGVSGGTILIFAGAAS